MSLRFTKLLAIQIFFICITRNYGQNSETLSIVPYDYVNSVAGLVKLLQMEAKLIKNINKFEFAYVMHKEGALLKLFMEKVKVEHKKSKGNPEAYLSNPMNSFALIRRMQYDWMKFQSFTQKLMGDVEIDLMKEDKDEMPTVNHTNEAAAGIYRIQKTYQLNIDDMINGNLNGRQYGSKFGSLDCVAIGDYLNDLNNCVQAINWYNAALKLYASYETELYKVFNISRANILYSSADCWLEVGNREQSLKTNKLALKLEPKRAAIVQFNDEIEQHINHDRLCRGEFSSQISKFHCRYNTWTTPYLKIAPLKLEEIAFNPYIALYHDVIFENEINIMKATSIPHFRRGATEKSDRDPERTANVYNYKFMSSNEGKKLFTRVVDMTGLYFNDSSVLQIANYGLGGHYYNHADYLTEEDLDFRLFGNRVASVIFFLNNVDQGGETAFPRIHKMVPARTGDAIVLYHLDNAKDNNRNSMHASCPVIFGSKWMGITSTYINGQIFLDKCLVKSNNNLPIPF